MKTIWKFDLAVAGETELMMPVGAEILDIHEQRGVVCIWAIVDPTNGTEARTFEVYGTGHPMSDYARSFVGTVHVDPFVWHIFEVKDA